VSYQENRPGIVIPGFTQLYIAPGMTDEEIAEEVLRAREETYEQTESKRKRRERAAWIDRIQQNIETDVIPVLEERQRCE
jgi:hypothetical protein